MIHEDTYLSLNFNHCNDIQIIDELEIIKNNFKINKVNYTYNDVSFEIYNHNGKYYFFHNSVFDEIIKTKYNPFNKKPLKNNVINRIILKKKINDLIKILIKKSKEHKIDFNELYNEFSLYDNIFIKKLNLYFVNFLYTHNIYFQYINDNLILQICTNIGFDLNKINNINIDTVIAVLSFIINKTI